jgi:hypothetical protein
MYQLGMVLIGHGNGGRGSFFSQPQSDAFRVGPALGYQPRYQLGVTAQEAYVNGKAEIAEFDSLVARTAKIANKAVRDQIVKDYGLNEPENKDKALYMRNATASCVATADSYTPVAYEQGFPNHGPCIGRVTKLRNFNGNFRSEVRDAENTYGILPEPVVITQYLPGQAAPAAAGGTNWTLPVVIGGGAIVIAALLGAFGGK